MLWNRSWLLLVVLGTALMACAVPTSAASARSAHCATSGRRLAQSVDGSFDPPDDGLPSTPELIELAFTRHEIDAERRLLYLAYALYESDSLPEVYRSDAPWFGTAAAEELAAWSQPLAGAESTTATATLVELERVLALADTTCKEVDGPASADSANFHLNYAPILGGLTAQDYLASLERTYTTVVGQYGWAKPPFCTKPACVDANPWGKYPVAVRATGGSLYGFVTTNGGPITGEIGDNSNTPAPETAASASCMVLNSDFSTFARGAQFSLDVTTAHEFIHSIQFGVGDPQPDEDAIWLESTAAYMEDEVADAADDNYQYLWPRFDTCLGAYAVSEDDWYTTWPLFRYIAERLGGANAANGGEDVVQSLWTNIAAGEMGLDAYAHAIQARGGSLAALYHDYAIAIFFNKSCPAGGAYCFEEAAGYAANRTPIAKTGELNELGDVTYSSLENHYSADFFQLPTTGVYSLRLSTVGGKLRGSVVAEIGDELRVTPFPNLAEYEVNGTLLEYEVPEGATRVFAIITNEDQPEANPASCEEAPYSISIAPSITFVVDDTISMAGEIGAAKKTMTERISEFDAEEMAPYYRLISFKDSPLLRSETADPKEMNQMIASLVAVSGRDCPEDSLGALAMAADKAPYSQAIWMTDAGFHGTLADLAKTIALLVKAHVTVNPVISGWCNMLAADVAAETSVAADDRAQTSAAEITEQERAVALSSPDSLLAGPALGPWVAQWIADATGGVYVQAELSHSAAAAQIVMEHIFASAGVDHYKGIVAARMNVTKSVFLDAGLTQVNFALASQIVGTQRLLYRPDGSLVAAGMPGVVVTGTFDTDFYQVDNPAPGRWSAVIVASPEYTVTYGIGVTGHSSVTVDYLGPVSVGKGRPVHLLARISGPVAALEFFFTHDSGAPAIPLTLLDDGLHQDGVAGDGIYAGDLVPQAGGDYYLKLQGTTTGGQPFQRVGKRMISVRDLSVEISPGDQMVAPGQTAQFFIAITNAGTGAEIVDLLRAETQPWSTLLSALPSALNLASGETRIFTVTLTVPVNSDGGEIDDVIVVASQRSNASISGASIVRTSVVTGADLSVTEVASAGVVRAGEIVTYTMQVHNHGPFTASQSLLTSTVPAPLVAGSVIVSAGNCVAMASEVRCTLGDIAPGASVYLSVAMLPSDDGTFAHVAQVGALLTDLNGANNSTRTVTYVTPVADLALQAGASAVQGAPLSFTLLVTNYGPSMAGQVIMTVTVPMTVTITSVTADRGSCTRESGRLVCSLGTMSFTDDASIVVAVTAAQPGSVHLAATVRTDTAELVLQNNADGATGIATGVTTAPAYPLYLPFVDK